MPAKTKVFIDAMPLSAERSSGVGHNLYGLVYALTNNADFIERYEVVLVTTVRGYRFLKLHNFRNVSYVRLPLLSRVMNRLPATPIMPAMDLLLGQGIYIFTNFRRWPLAKSRSATTIHDLGFILHPETVGSRNRAVLAANVPRWANGSDIVMTVSENARKELIEHLELAPGKVRVVPNGVDPKEYYPRTEAEVSEVREKYGLPADYILFVGNIEPRKNLERLVRAYRALPKTISNRHALVIVGGSGWLSEAIEAEIAQANDSGHRIIRPAAYVVDADLPALYTGAALLVHPALYEGFGMPVLEAMATGTPVVASDNSSLPEVVGGAGIMVNALDEQAITSAIEKVLTDRALRDKLISAGFKQAGKYTWTTAGAKLIAIIDELAQKQKGHK